MAVSDGNRVSAAVTNAAFLSRTQDSDTVGVVGLNHPSSGGVIANAQQKINDNTTEIQSNDVDISILQTDKEDKNNKNQPNGYCPLDGTGRVPSANLPLTALEYLGTWDASTNTPTLADGSGTNGDLYRVSVAGTQDLGSGSLEFKVGDWVTYNGSVWQRSDTEINGVIDDLDDVDTSTVAPVIGQALIWDGSNWVPQTASGGGSGSGRINYVLNPDVETDGTGFTKYNDGASDTPVDGDGGTSANLTISRTTTVAEVLRGDASLRLTKSSNNAQGEGFNLDVLEIDAQDQFKRLEFSFDFKDYSGTYEDNQIKVFMYDIDNATLLGAVENDENGGVLASTEGYRFVGFFNATDSLNYRPIIHVADTTTTAWGVSFDSFLLGPVEFVPATATNTIETKILSSSVSNGVVSDISWNDLEIGASYELTFQAQINLPSPQSENLATFFATHDGNNICRGLQRIQQNAGTLDNTDTIFTGNCKFTATASDLNLEVAGLGTGGTLIGNGTKNTTFAQLEKRNDLSTNVVSNTKLTQETSVVKIFNSASQNLVTGTVTDLDLDSAEISKGSGLSIDLPNNKIVCNKDGLYRVSAQAGVINLATDQSMFLQIEKNGSPLARATTTADSTAGDDPITYASTTVSLVVGDEINMAMAHNHGSDRPTQSGAANNFLLVESIPDFTTYGVASPKTEELVSIDTGLAIQSNPVADQWYVLDLSWNLPLTEGTWQIYVKTYIQIVNNSASNGAGCQVGISTSSTPGANLIDVFNGGVCIGENGDYQNFDVQMKELTVSSPTTIYLHFRCLNGYGSYFVDQLNLRNDRIEGLPGAGGEIRARRIK